MAGECFLAHYTPHFVDVGESIEALVIVIIEGSPQCHLIYTVLFCNKSEKLGNKYLKAIHSLKRLTKEFLEILISHSGAVCRPEEPIYHSLPFLKETLADKNDLLLKKLMKKNV